MARPTATATDADLKLFISRQLALLSREKDAEVEQTSLLISNCGLKLLEQRGLALGNLGVVTIGIGLGGKSLIELERPSAYHNTNVFPPHTFRPGDLARIDEYVSTSSTSRKSRSNGRTQCVSGVVYKVLDTRIVLAVEPSRLTNEELDIPARCSLIKMANLVTHERMYRAVNQLSQLVLPEESITMPSDPSHHGPRQGPNSLHRVLMGLSVPTMSPSVTQHAPTLFFDSSLNASQVKAVRFALGSPEVACIHGPPGTGKTRVLIEIIRQLVYSPDEALSCRCESGTVADPPKAAKILVCGGSNLAVDNVLERLSLPVPTPAQIHITSPNGEVAIGDAITAQKMRFPPMTLTRLGHPAKVLSSLLPRTLEVQSQASDEAVLVKDVKAEIEEIMCALNGKKFTASNVSSTSSGIKSHVSQTDNVKRATGRKGRRLHGDARKEAWQTIKALRKEYRKREEGVVKSVISKAQVILATCHGAGSRQIRDMEFDVVIIDEATQALEAVCWIPILKGKKLILAGDPMQLGPTIISEGSRRRTNHERAQNHRRNSQPGTAGVETTSPTRPKTSPYTQVTNEPETMSHHDTPTSSSSSEENDNTPKSKDLTTVMGKNNPAPHTLLRPSKSLSTTLFHRLEAMHGERIKRMLEVQYRMNMKICSFPSKILYHSRLIPHKANASQLLSDLPGVSEEEEYQDVVGIGSEIVFWDTAGAEFRERNGNVNVSGDDGGSLCNENEAELVTIWVHKLMAAGVHPSQIAVITPYQAQSQLLADLLPEPDIEIGTADGMQGREREAVVLSLVRSNPEGEVGFLKEKRRLNVAMTRAKRHLCVVGDSSTIRRGGGKFLKKWMDWLEQHADVRFAGDAQR